MSLTEEDNDLKLVVTRETGSRTGSHHPLHPPSVRPLIIGGGLVGLTLSSFLYLLPSLLCTTTYHPFLATVYLMAALSAPLITSVMVTNAILYNGPPTLMRFSSSATQRDILMDRLTLFHNSLDSRFTTA